MRIFSLAMSKVLSVFTVKRAKLDSTPVAALLGPIKDFSESRSAPSSW